MSLKNKTLLKVFAGLILSLTASTYASADTICGKLLEVQTWARIGYGGVILQPNHGVIVIEGAVTSPNAAESRDTLGLFILKKEHVATLRAASVNGTDVCVDYFAHSLNIAAVSSATK